MTVAVCQPAASGWALSDRLLRVRKFTTSRDAEESVSSAEAAAAGAAVDSGCAAAGAARRRSSDEAAPRRHAAPELATAEAERAAESRAEDSMLAMAIYYGMSYIICGIC